MVCHTVSGLKCGIRRTPPRLLEAQKNTWGGVYFTWSGEIFLRNFMPYPPPKNSRVKGGDLLRKLTARVPQMGFPPNFCSICVLQNFTGASLAGGFKTMQNESLGIIKVLWLNKNMLKPTTRSTIL